MFVRIVLGAILILIRSIYKYWIALFLMQGVRRLEPRVSRKQVYNQGYVITAIVFGLVFIGVFAFAVYSLGLNGVLAFVLGVSIVVIYAVLLFFLLEPSLMTEVVNREIREFEKPVIKEVIKPVEVVKTIEKPVVKYVDRPVYVPKPRKKTKSVHYKFVGSSNTKVYHSTRSRLARLIKYSNRVYGNTHEFFKARGFHPAKHLIDKMSNEKRKKALKKYRQRKKKEKNSG